MDVKNPFFPCKVLWMLTRKYGDSIASYLYVMEKKIIISAWLNLEIQLQRSWI